MSDRTLSVLLVLFGALFIFVAIGATFVPPGALRDSLRLLCVGHAFAFGADTIRKATK